MKKIKEICKFLFGDSETIPDSFEMRLRNQINERLKAELPRLMDKIMNEGIKVEITLKDIIEDPQIYKNYIVGELRSNVYLKIKKIKLKDIIFEYTILLNNRVDRSSISSAAESFAHTWNPSLLDGIFYNHIFPKMPIEYYQSVKKSASKIINNIEESFILKQGLYREDVKLIDKQAIINILISVTKTHTMQKTRNLLAPILS